MLILNVFLIHHLKLNCSASKYIILQPSLDQREYKILKCESHIRNNSNKDYNVYDLKAYDTHHTDI